MNRQRPPYRARSFGWDFRCALAGCAGRCHDRSSIRRHYLLVHGLPPPEAARLATSARRFPREGK